jgi:phenylpyruvate tautomerase PptA (4-oxalocrotonate tautomerase family)
MIVAMAQIVVYGHAAALRPRIRAVSDAIHAASVAALELPESKRFHRFVPLEPDCFITPDDRSDDYTIVEVSMFEGRGEDAKKAFIRAVYANLGALGIAANDVEIKITETPRAHWGIRGVPADELALNYRIDV